MADIVTVLADAVNTLGVTVHHPEVSDYHRQSAVGLVDRISVRIHAFQPRRKEPEFIALVPRIHGHVLRMKEAIGAADFGEVVRHGILVMDALPGEEQSDPKAPWGG